MTNELSTTLRFGPYALPTGLGLGDTIHCEYRRIDLLVVEITEAPVQWFRCRPGQRGPLIICGDLVRAIRNESASAVAKNWGVNKATVTAWRRSLGVGRMTLGTTEVFREVFDGRLTRQDYQRAWTNSKSEQAIAKMSASKRGKPVQLETRKALLKAAKRPKSHAHREAMSRAHRARGTVPPGVTPWTKAEDQKLGKLPDRQLAALIGKSVEAVRGRRRRLGIASFNTR